MQELWVKSQDVELYTQVHGNADMPTVVLLHGYPDCHRTWGKQVEAFQQDYQVVCFDMRGAGRSTCSSQEHAYRIDNMMADIEAVIDAVVGKQGRVHLVGHDWGSVIGWSFITEEYYAQRVISYTSMSGPHLGLMLSWARRCVLSGDVRQFRDLAQQLMNSWYVAFFNVPRVPELLLKRFGLFAWKHALQDNGVNKTDPYLDIDQHQLESFTLNTLGLYRQNPLSPPEIPQKNAIKVPVQLIVPTGDNFISDKLYCYYGDYVQRLSKHEIDAKHWAHHSHSKKFNRWVMQFIQGVEQEKDKRVA